MRKIYIEPEIEIVELHMGAALLSGSTGAEGGDGDGGTTPQQGDPTDPDWGSDY